MLSFHKKEVYAIAEALAHKARAQPRSDLFRSRAELAGAVLTGTDGSQIVEAVDAGGVAVGKIDLNGVVAHGVGAAGLGPGLEHGQHGGSRRAGRGRRRPFPRTLVVAQRTGTLVAQINEIVVAGVVVRPGDVHATAGGDVYLHVRRFFSRVERQRHFVFILSDLA